MNDCGQGAHNNVVGWGQAAKSGMNIGWGSICFNSWSLQTNLVG